MSLIDDPAVLYTLPSIVIGRHEWILQVYTHPEYGSPCIRYCWRRRDFGDPRWRHESEWPHYNPHDGVHVGLPLRLSKLLYYANEFEISQVLATGKPPTERRQAELFPT